METDAAGDASPPRYPPGIDGIVERWGPAGSWQGMVVTAFNDLGPTGWFLGTLRSVHDPLYVSDQIENIQFPGEEPVGLHVHEDDLHMLTDGGRTLWRGHPDVAEDPARGALWVAGAIDAIEGQPTSNLFVVLGDNAGAFATGPNGPVHDIALTGPGILLAGDFHLAGGLPSHNIAEWSGDPRTVSISPGENGQPPTPHIARAILHAPKPDPFNPSVTLTFTLPAARDVELVIHDLRGRRVRTLLTAHCSTGRHEVIWDGTGARGRAVASGTYLAVLTAGDERDVRKLTLVR